MLFHTYIFAVFFAVVYVGYVALRRTRYRIYWFFVASYVFYGWWNPWFLILIFYSTSVDYLMGRWMAAARNRKLPLVISIVNNLGLLCFYKYTVFLVDNVNTVLGWAGVEPYERPSVYLPVGISFFIFQSMSYTIDLYRNKVALERNYVRFLAFVSFFPQLVAGPIERAGNLLPQLAGRREVTITHLSDGLTLFLIGLFKKVALADFFAIYADRVYNSPEDYGSLALILATYSFAWQIYFDFSGYTDMARGVARAMGYDLMQNFNHPYLSTTVGEFWRRWHISLSTWFRDYVYIPLGGNRHGALNTHRNMLLTMVISGLWHGASWNFVIWGFLNGLGILVTARLDRLRFYRSVLPKAVKQFLIFNFACVTWIFFRCGSMEDGFSAAIGVLWKILSFDLSDPQYPVFGILLMLFLWIYQNVAESDWKRFLEYRSVRVCCVLAMLLYLSFFARSAASPFIYFQF